VAIPDHFEPLVASPFSERIGPLYVSRLEEGAVVGVRIEPYHANRAGRALIHASCALRSGERNVARAMGTFAVRLG
jgi:hypothetical protein